MANYRAIMQLSLAGRSYAEIVEMVGCSRRDVALVKKTISTAGMTSERALSITDAEIGQLFPDGRRKVSQEYDQPDFAATVKSMKANRHFTLQQAWRRYVGSTAAGKKYGYSQYCALFSEQVRSLDLVATLHHEPGRAMLVDWAGDTLELVDAVSGQVSKAYLFVAVLPFSGVVFCRAFMSMKSEAWLAGHVGAFEFLGGVPQLVIPDNPTTATVRPTRGDAAREVNARYQQLADHYGTAIVPARVRKPRDKAAVEKAVDVVNKRVIGYLAEEVWTSLTDLNTAITERVQEINEAIRRADGTTRWERFEAEESALLGPLPAERFEEVEWKQVKAGRNYHIACDSQYYSVPYALAGRLLRVRLSAVRVTVFDGHDIVCEHRRLRGRKGQYSTLAEHVPAAHRDVAGLWSRRWFTDRARSYGPATVTVIEQILDRHAIEAQGYLDCQNILNGIGKRNRQRLEAACQEIVNRNAYPTYTTVKRVLAAIDSDTKKPAVVTPAASTRKPPAAAEPSVDVFVRDASHYGQQAGL